MFHSQKAQFSPCLPADVLMINIPPSCFFLASMTHFNSIPLAQGLSLASSRYMTLQADISHVFGKKVARFAPML